MPMFEILNQNSSNEEAQNHPVCGWHVGCLPLQGCPIAGCKWIRIMIFSVEWHSYNGFLLQSKTDFWNMTVENTGERLYMNGVSCDQYSGHVQCPAIAS
jgi:hypothetical protein